MGLNQFSDMSEAEYSAYLGFNHGAWLASTKNVTRAPELESFHFPTEFDWRAEGKVSPVKNQASCGSCWAFSGVGAIEANLLIDGQPFLSLSEQQYVDCVPNPESCGGTGGCGGATQPLLFDYALGAGSRSEGDYVYTAKNGACTESAYSTIATIEGFGILPENCGEATLKAYLLKKGPIAVSVDASSWGAYSSGVLPYSSCGADINHAVLLVGYGTEPATGADYWTIKNSWGESWGESGYIRISREDGTATDASPSDGTGCADGPDAVEVRGTCGIYYANSFVFGAKVVAHAE